MIDHISTYATDYSKSKAFYQAVFSALGYLIQTEFVAHWNEDFPNQRLCAFGNNGKSIFWIIEVKVKYTPRHVALSATSRSAVDDFYNKGLASFGKDNGLPGIRAIYHPNYYGAFLIDPDGNNIEAVCHLAE